MNNNPTFTNSTKPRLGTRQLRLAASLVLTALGVITGFVALAGQNATFFATSAATPAAGIITTVAGGTGFGAANNVGQSPADVAVRNGVLYVADVANRVVRAVDLATGEETVFAGHDQAGPVPDGAPADWGSATGPLVFDSAGNLYIGAGARIRKVDANPSANGYRRITTVAGVPCQMSRASVDKLDCFSGDGGPATSAEFNSIAGMVFDRAGNLYVADAYNNRVRRIDAQTQIVTTVAGSGPGHNPALNECAVQGAPVPVGDGGLATAALLCVPTDVEVDPDGNLYIADSYNHRIRRVDALTQTISTVAGSGPVGLGFEDFGGDGGPADMARLSYPSGVDLDDAGDLFIADYCNNRIRKVEAPPVGGKMDGTQMISTVVGQSPRCGSFIFAGDGGPASSANMEKPVDVIFDAAGNLYIADSGNLRVRKVNAAASGSIDGTQIITTVAGNGHEEFGGDGGFAVAAQLERPFAATFDSAGNLLVADTANHRIRRIETSGKISTIAGSGLTGFTAGGYSGDTGPALSARLNLPVSVATDSEDNVYILDAGNNRVRKVDRSGTITTVAGTGSLVCSERSEVVHL